MGLLYSKSFLKLFQKFHGQGIGRPILACLHSSLRPNATLYSEAMLLALHGDEGIGDTKMYGLSAGPIGWLAAVPTHSTIPHYASASQQICRCTIRSSRSYRFARQTYAFNGWNVNTNLYGERS